MVDGYFTFATSRNNEPLKINEHYIIDAVHFGEKVKSLRDTLSLHAVQSLTETETWVDTDQPTTAIELNYIGALKVERKDVKLVGKAAKVINFRADDGALIDGLMIDRDLKLLVQAQSGDEELTATMKEDFIKEMEDNFSIYYDRKVYKAVYHDEAVQTDYGRDTLNGYFTFESSGSGIPLKVENHFIIDAVHFGEKVKSLQDALSLHAVQSLEDTQTWVDTDQPTTLIGLEFAEVMNVKATGGGR
jgi:hypothetical protein